MVASFALVAVDHSPSNSRSFRTIFLGWHAECSNPQAIEPRNKKHAASRHSAKRRKGKGQMSVLQTYDDRTDLLEESRPATISVPTSDHRFRHALACLGAAWALSWAELALAVSVGLPGEATAHPLAASVVSRVLVALLYACVAARLQWARWVTVALGIVSVAFVAPTLALQWHVFPAAAVVCGAGLVCKLAASFYLIRPVTQTDRA
jgi:hypothetical protein